MSPPIARLNDFSPNRNPSCCRQFGEGGGRFRLAQRDRFHPNRADRVAASATLCLSEILAHGLAREVHDRAADASLAPS
jgi:hypothetical protein